MSLLFVFQLSVLCVLMEICYVDESCLTETVQLKRKKNNKKKKWAFVCILFNYLLFCQRINVCVRPQNNNVK